VSRAIWHIEWRSKGSRTWHVDSTEMALETQAEAVARIKEIRECDPGYPELRARPYVPQHAKPRSKKGARK
jgi:hypothetical protein